MSDAMDERPHMNLAGFRCLFGVPLASCRPDYVFRSEGATYVVYNHGNALAARDDNGNSNLALAPLALARELARLAAEIGVRSSR